MMSTSSLVSADAYVPSPTQRTPETYLDELARHVAMSTSQRYPRPPNFSRPNAMRIVKPGSNSHSPRAALMQQRRRTMLTTDGLLTQRQWMQYAEQQQQQQQQQQQVQQPSYLHTPTTERDTTVIEPVRRALRPVSWHPSTRGAAQMLAQEQVQQATMIPPSQQYPFSIDGSNTMWASQLAAQFPPTPAAYSAYASPTVQASAGYEAAQYFSPAWQPTQESPMVPSVYNTSFDTSFSQPQNALIAPTYVTMPNQSPPSLDWDTFASRGFESQNDYRQVTAPPTPLDPPMQHQPAPALIAEVEDDGGEVLVGMGLYDAPNNKEGSSMFFGSDVPLFGSSDRSSARSLRLEAPWSPPAMDDDDDDEEDGDDEEDEDGQSEPL